MADGSVSTLAEGMDHLAWRALLTPDGDEIGGQ